MANDPFVKIDRFLKSLGVDPEGKRIWVGVSGGPDSVFLFEYLINRKSRSDFHLTVLHVNHMLRGVESDEDEEFVRSLAKKHSVPLIVERVDVSSLKKRGESLEEAARRLRYEVFSKYDSEYDYFFTAHNLDDNVETVIFNFFRGTGVRGLAGIPPVRGKFIRPLLEVSRGEILDFIRREGIPFRIDATNFDTVYTRNLIRHEILPYLSRKFGRDLIDRFARNIVVYRRLREFIESRTEILFGTICSSRGDCIECDLKQLTQLTAFERGEMIIHAFRLLGVYSGSMDLVDSIEKILHREQETMTPLEGDYFAFTCNGKLLMCKGNFQSFTTFPILELSIPFDERWGNWRIKGNGEVPREGDYIGGFSHDAFPQGRVIVRAYMPGDRIKMRYGDRVISRKLKDLFSSRKIGRMKRKFIPVIANSRNEIVWVPGLAFREGTKGKDIFLSVTNLTREW